MEPQNTHGRSYDVITDALTRTVGPAPHPRSPLYWTNYLCPVHENDGQHHNPSLGVRYDPAQGKTMVRCWARCSGDEVVLDRIGLQVRDLWDRLPERNPNRTNPRRPPQVQTPQPRKSLVDKAIDYAQFPPQARPDQGAVTGPPEVADTYTYRWPDGMPEGEVIRLHEPHEHGHKKLWQQRHWLGNRWEASGFAALPYRLPEVTAAVAQRGEIFVCEGEKDVNRAYEAGLVGTCNAMGAGSWSEQHAPWLYGAGRVVIVADRDRSGYRHADKVAASLVGHVEEIRVVQAAVGKDLSDHLDAGRGINDLEMVPYLDRHYRDPRVHQQHQHAETPTREPPNQARQTTRSR